MLFRNYFIVLPFLLVLFQCALSEFITLSILGAVAGAGWYKWNTIKDNTYCRYAECCNDQHVPFDINKLKLSLSQRMFGQPLVDELVNIMHAHKEAVHDENKRNKKALVISLHGWPGVGKNYAATMIAEALYSKGMHSKYVKLFMGKKDFDCSNLQQKKEDLVATLNNIVRKCPRSLIIFDEIHDMCPSVLDTIKPMLDHHHAVDGIDYRDSIFIFISNIGGQEIASKLIDLYGQGAKRSEVEFHDFEPIIRRTAYFQGGFEKAAAIANHLIDHYVPLKVGHNDEYNDLIKGGFEKAAAIANHLIDHYVPFLPLEQQHVEMCALAEFRSHAVYHPTKEMMAEALSVITYGPNEDQPIFANNGCKRFTRHIPYIIQKNKQKIEL